MEKKLEQMCLLIDGVLARHGLSAKVAGGYLARSGLLLSLTDTTFVDTNVRYDIKRALNAKHVAATVGVVLISNWSPPEDGVIEGQYQEIEPASEGNIETIDVMELIARHEAEETEPIQVPLRDYRRISGVEEESIATR